MRIQRESYRWWLGMCLVFLMSTVSSTRAHAQNQGSQVLKLPDPTPRDMTPELRYHIDPSLPIATQKMMAAQNEKRWQLIVWATDELVVLSERAEKAALAPPGDASKKELAGNVTKIETLSKNLAIALKAR